MGDSAIEWTDKVWNPLTGCTRVSAGCDHCYAFQLHDQRHVAWRQGRMPSAAPQYHQPFSTVQLFPDRLTQPLSWRKPARVFVNSMSDLFHEDVPDEFIARVFAVMALAPQHTFQVLTKRPERMAAWIGSQRLAVYAAAHAGEGGRQTPQGRSGATCWATFDGPWPLPNVWLGTSVENQAAADERIPHLLRTPAAVRFLSVEPMLGPVDLRCVQHNGEFEIDALTGAHGVYRPLQGTGPRIDWVITGGESGPHARPSHPDWVRSLRDQCAAAGVAYFFKQWGEWMPTFPYARSGDIRLRADGCITGTVAECEPDGESMGSNPFGFRGNGQVSDALIARKVERDDRLGNEFTMGRVGKKAAGRLLDGVTHDGAPGVG